MCRCVWRVLVVRGKLWLTFTYAAWGWAGDRVVDGGLSRCGGKGMVERHGGQLHDEERGHAHNEHHQSGRYDSVKEAYKVLAFAVRAHHIAIPTPQEKILDIDMYDNQLFTNDV